MSPSTTQTFKSTSVLSSRCDPALSRLARNLPSFLGVLDAGATHTPGGLWFVDAWRELDTDERGVRHCSWVVRLGRHEFTLDFTPVPAGS
jgi:hypothetical protein